MTPEENGYWKQKYLDAMNDLRERRMLAAREAMKYLRAETEVDNLWYAILDADGDCMLCGHKSKKLSEDGKGRSSESHSPACPIFDPCGIAH